MLPTEFIVGLCTGLFTGSMAAILAVFLFLDKPIIRPEEWEQAEYTDIDPEKYIILD